MKKETIKEIGKLLIDISKIIFAIAFLIPIIKDNAFSFLAILIVIYTTITGFCLINKGN